MAHTFNPSTWEAEAGGFLSFQASLVYIVSSRTARAIQRNPVSKNKQTNKKDKSVDTFILLRRQNKIPMEGVTETKCEAEGEGMTIQRLPHPGSPP